MAILIADKGYFRVKTIAKNKVCDLIKIKESSSQEDTKILNVSSSNNRTLRYIRENLFKKRQNCKEKQAKSISQNIPPSSLSNRTS